MSDRRPGFLFLGGQGAAKPAHLVGLVLDHEFRFHALQLRKGQYAVVRRGRDISVDIAIDLRQALRVSCFVLLR